MPMDLKGKNGLQILERLSEWIFLATGLAVLVITVLISYDVLMRYFLNRPQLFVDELTAFILVGVIFLGTAPTFHRGGHIRIDLVTSRLRQTTQRRLRLITLSVGIAMLGVVIYQTGISAWMAYTYGRVSAVMVYPLWIGMVLIPIGLFLMALFMVVNLLKEIRSKPEG